MTSWIESQIETRAKYDSALNERAYAELAASVSGGRAAPRLVVDDVEQVEAAARACLAYLGVEPGAAPRSASSFEERLDWICRPTGTMRRDVQLDGRWWKNAFGAMIGRLTTGETVALLPHGFSGYCYLEPGTRRRVKVTAEVARLIEPDAVLFYKPLPAKPLKTHDLAAFIFGAFDRNDYLFVFAAALVVTLVGLAPAWANKVAFGVVAPSGQAGLILPVAALLLGVAVSAALFGICRNLVMARVSAKLDLVAEAATFARVLSLPTSFFKQYSSGDLASRVSNVTLLAQTLTTMIMGSALTALFSLIYVVQIGAFAPSLALPSFAVVVVQAVVVAVSCIVTARYERATMEANAKLSGEVTALLGGIQKIKLAGAEERAFAKWAHGYAAYARPAYNRPMLVKALPAIVTLIGLVGVVAIYYLAGSTGVSIDNFMAFNAAFGQVSVAILELANIAGQIAQIRPMLEMAAPILEQVPEVAEGKPSIESISGEIEVAGVSFRYNEDSPYILRDLSFKVRSGEYVAIVGKSGCGKSTIVRLLLGFEVPERGSVFYGAHDVRQVDLRSLRHHIGVVMQDGRLFMGDIASNITISTPGATLDDAWEAAELAGISDDIRKMPMGMQTLVTEGGGGISGGQRQRLMIARAVCGKKNVLIFDEATSALDNVTQKHVSDSLASLNCTRIVVAHRLSTVRHCDRILVVDNGGIVEEGTYEELVGRDGVFAELVEKQRLDVEE